MKSKINATAGPAHMRGRRGMSSLSHGIPSGLGSTKMGLAAAVARGCIGVAFTPVGKGYASLTPLLVLQRCRREPPPQDPTAMPLDPFCRCRTPSATFEAALASKFRSLGLSGLGFGGLGVWGLGFRV